MLMSLLPVTVVKKKYVEMASFDNHFARCWCRPLPPWSLYHTKKRCVQAIEISAVCLYTVSM